MKSFSFQSLLLVSALSAPWLQAQDATAKVHEIEQKVLQKQYQDAVHALVGSAREAESGETSVGSEIIGKRMQWLAMVDAQIGAGGKTSIANNQDMAESAETLNGLAWKMVTSPDAGDHHPEIALKLATIAVELDGENKDLLPRLLDTKARSLFLLGKREEAISEQEKAVAAATVADQKTRFEASLDAYRKNELPEALSPPNGHEGSNEMGAAPLSAGVARIAEKLKTIVIPSIDLEDATLEEAVEFLRKQSIELDTAELDPARKGLNFVLRMPPASPQPDSGASSNEDLSGTTAEPGSFRIKNLHLRNVPLAVALKYICDATRFRFRVDDFAVTLVHRDAAEDLFTRTFRVPHDFILALDSGSGANSAFGDRTNHPPVMELLKANGINFVEGSSVSLTASGTLMVTNTPTELDKIEQLIAAIIPNER